MAITGMLRGGTAANWPGHERCQWTDSDDSITGMTRISAQLARAFTVKAFRVKFKLNNLNLKKNLPVNLNLNVWTGP